MVTRYDVIRSRWLSHLGVKICLFSPFRGEKSINCSQKAAVFNYVIFYKSIIKIFNFRPSFDFLGP